MPGVINDYQLSSIDLSAWRFARAPPVPDARVVYGLRGRCAFWILKGQPAETENVPFEHARFYEHARPSLVFTAHLAYNYSYLKGTNLVPVSAGFPPALCW